MKSKKEKEEEEEEEDIIPIGSIVYYNIRHKEWRKLKKRMKTNRLLGIMIKPPDQVMIKGGFNEDDSPMKRSFITKGKTVPFKPEE